MVSCALPDWLCNVSYDPALQDLLRRDEPKQDEEAESSESERSEEESSPDDSPDGESLPTEESQDKPRHRRERRRTKRRTVEAAEQPIPEGKRRFRFLLGIPGEERFCVDPKPQRNLLAFDCLPFNELAVFPRGWRCDTAPLESR
ncbi:hypothetical protein HPB50_001171 [Hyalomma asiaticum]|uniref:Uncharacterized protein n=1 Tax=Hyalomma asiaticum TaxID=266040 RepID=A0ACB7RRV8_HYAAI|nr:hypothetical protein HPB50_001171 [Hyalomma asiaticum]